MIQKKIISACFILLLLVGGRSAFAGCTISPVNSANLQGAADSNADISTCNVSSMTSMNGLFSGKTSLNQDLSAWDVSNVTNMANMFFGATSFNNGGAAMGWTTTDLTTMETMFQGATSFNQDISSWDVDKVTSFNKAFRGATAFNNGGAALTWTTSNVLVDLEETFRGATSFDQDVSSWNVSQVNWFDNFLMGATLSTANYGALLVAWDNQAVRPSKTFHGGNSDWCVSGDGAATARAHLISADSWSFTDGSAVACSNPILNSSVPSDNAVNVAVNANIVLTFNEVVDRESGNILIKKTSDDSTFESIAVTDSKVTGTGTTSITINPAGTFASATGYYVIIPNTAFDDTSSNSYAGISAKTALNFTSIDNVDPTLTSSVPADNATGISETANIVLTFSEAVAVGSGNITIINTSTSATVATIAVGSSAVSVSSNVVTINPASALASSTAFHVLIPATAFDDAATNSYAGISGATALNFVTGDSIAPTLSSSTPTDNATGVGLNANIVLNFSENVDVETGNILIKKTSDDSTFESIPVGNSKVTGTGGTAITINPAGTFASSTGYYLVIPSTAFDDAASNDYAGFSTKTILNFTSADSVAPTLASSSPADNATGVAEGSNIVLTFSEVVDRESGNITIKKTSGNATVEVIAVTDSKITGTGTNIITINPTANLTSSTEFYVLIDNTAFDDTSSNSYAGISSTTALSFTTSDTVSPLLSSSSPADNATGIGVSSNIILNFSEVVDLETGNIVIKRTDNDNTVETITHSGGLITGTGTTQITINPAAALAELTSFYLTIDATLFDDPSSNSYAGITAKTALNFTTSDSSNPILTSSAPSDNSTGVAANANIVLNFNEVVDRESGNISIKKTSDNSTFEIIGVTDSKITGTGSNQITINPAGTFASKTQYYVLIAATAFDDTSSNSYAGISSTTALNFISADVENPTLSSSTPADDSTGFGISDNIILNFNEEVDVETGNILIKKTSDDSTIETITHNGGLVSGSGTTQITINPAAALAELTSFYLTIASTFFDDAAGNDYAGIVSKTTLNFTTSDASVPTLASATPADNATGVSETANIVLTFSEAVDAESGNIIIKKTSDDTTFESIPVGNSKVSVSSNVVTINPAGVFASSTGYYVVVDATAFDDPSGNSYAGISAKTTLNFTTGDSINPSLSSSTPTDGATGVALTSDIVLNFSEAVDVETGNIIITKTSGSVVFDTIPVGNSKVTGTGTTQITINPAGSLASDTAYHVTIAATAFDDPLGNSYAGISDATTLNFVTLDTIDPTLSSSVPVDNATGVGINANIVLTFSEAVDVESGNIKIMKTSDNSTIETIAVGSGKVTGTGTNAITINPAATMLNSTGYYVLIDASAFDDPSSNSYGGISGTTTLNYTTEADTTNPTLSSSSPIDGATGVGFDELIILTFSEVVDVETGNITIKKLSDNSIVESIAVGSSKVTGTGTTQITINPAISLPELTAYYINIDATAFDDTASNSYAGIGDVTTLNFATKADRLPTPLAKVDVIGSIEATNDIASEWSGTTLKNINNRISWLDANKGSTRTSYQGIKLRFHNEVIDVIMNSSPSTQAYNELYFSNKAKNIIQNTDGSLLAVSGQIKSDVTGMVLNEASQFRQTILSNLNLSFEPVVDSWSMWTEGELFFGKAKATSSSSQQAFNAQSVALGFDRPTNNDGLVGFAIDFGQSNTDVGVSASNVQSGNFSLSNYNVFKLDRNTQLQSVFGLGRLVIDTKRTDGLELLSGNRKANQVFYSTTLKRQYSVEEDNQLFVSPYITYSSTRTNLDGYSESGGTTALTFNDQVLRDVKVGVGVDINSFITAANNSTIKPYASVEYNRASSKTGTTMRYTAEPVENAYTTSHNKSNNNLQFKLGTSLMVDDSWDVSVNYLRKQSIGSTSKSSNSFSLNGDYKF